MKLDRWNEGYQIVVDEADIKKMVQCSGMGAAIEKMNSQAKGEGLKVKRILMPGLTGMGIFSVPVVEATLGVIE